VLVNHTRAGGVDELATAIIERVLSDDVVVGNASPWEPGPACPDDLAPILGTWWSEGDEFVLSWRSGALRAHLRRAPTQESVFEEEDPGTFRVADGHWYGERLRIERDEHGRITGFEWATYPFTRWPS
jgi:hypothetical protein